MFLYLPTVSLLATANQGRIAKGVTPLYSRAAITFRSRANIAHKPMSTILSSSMPGISIGDASPTILPLILFDGDNADDVFLMTRVLRKFQILNPITSVGHGQNAIDYLAGYDHARIGTFTPAWPVSP
jgi:hypothetical protein